MSKANMDKVFKELNKIPDEEIIERFREIKQFLSQKLIAKSTEYSELAEKFIELSNSVNK